MMTEVYAALGHRFEVYCDLPELAAEIQRIFAPLRASDVEADLRYEVVIDDPDQPPYRLLADGEELLSASRPSRPLGRLLHHVNVTAIERSQHLTLLHGASAATSVGAVLLPAPMESGKSTLVTGLVRAGWRYLTDELLAIDPATGLIHPYPRAISLDAGSWDLFRELAPPAGGGTVERFRPHQWQLPVERFGAVVREPTPITGVVFPRFDTEETTRLDPLDPVEGLRQLLACCFTLRQHPHRDVTVLAEVMERVDAHVLSMSDLDPAVDLVERHLGDGSPVGCSALP